MAFSYIGLLCQGKSDYESIEQFRKDDFFKQALQLRKVPSCSIMRQRFDAVGEQWNVVIKEEIVNLLKNNHAVLTPCIRKFIPLDIDVSPFDNSNTKKEGVSRTYKGCDGYAPIFTYLGREGYCINTELREGKTHCQKGTPEFIKQSVLYAKAITNEPLLVRLDSGNDAIDNIKILYHKDTKADFIIKRNLRKESLESWLTIAKQKGTCYEPREGKCIYTGSINTKIKGIETTTRLIFKVTERTIKANGQILLIPDIEVETYWTSLPDSVDTIIQLYHAHGTSEQFHSEIKTDLNLERLPSDKFSSNHLVLTLGVMAYNLLRLIGQESLKRPDAPLRKQASRRRIRTVIQNLITIAAKLVTHANKTWLKFGRQSPWFNTFNGIYEAFR